MTDAIKDGGPAFPRTVQGWNGHLDAMDGMTLRDWFAGQALPGLIQGYATAYGSPTSALQQMVDEAFLMADYMIETRISK